MIVCKLGGSVITEKDRRETLDTDSLAVVTDAIGRYVETGGMDLVLVHGAGSFGHYHAAAHGVDTTEGTHSAVAVNDIHGSMKALNVAILDRLLDRGVPAVPVHPLSMASRDAAGSLSFPTAVVSGLLEEGFVPVVHGDVVVQDGVGTTIVSGDEIVARIAASENADRIGLCSSVDGVLDDGDVVPSITSYDAVESILGGSDATDVTGGMAAKVAALLDLGVRASIFGLDDLEAFLAGDAVGTTIDGSQDG